MKTRETSYPNFDKANCTLGIYIIAIFIIFMYLIKNNLKLCKNIYVCYSNVTVVVVRIHIVKAGGLKGPLFVDLYDFTLYK